MRRRLLLFLGALLFLVAAFAALAYVLPPPVPFQFLEGQRPVALNIRAQDARILDQMDFEYRMYSFKADYPAVTAAADKELKTAGYTENAGMMSSGSKGLTTVYTKPITPPTSSSAGAAPAGEDLIVGFMKDTQVTSETPMNGESPEGNAPGWVTVVVTGKRSKSMLDKLRDWVGF